MSINGYNMQKSKNSKDELEFQVTNHKNYFKESLDELNQKLNEIVEHAYSGNFVETIRAARTFKESSEHLAKHADHLIFMIEHLAEPDHGGE